MILKKERPTQVLVAKIEEFLKNQPPYQSKSNKVSPTYLLACLRQCFYKMKGLPQKEKQDARSIRIAENGNYMHKRYFDFFEKMGILKEKEKFVSHPTYPFLGYIDAIITLDGKDYLVELKSISHDSFSKLTKPLEEHQMQLKMYLMLLKEISEGILLYEDKNTQEIKEFHVIYDKAIEEWFTNRMDTLLDYFNRNEEPPRICLNYTDGVYKWCPYVDICFKEGKE